MFSREALPKFWFVSQTSVDSLLAIRDRHWRKLATTFEKAESANLPPFARQWCLFMWGAYFRMGACKRNGIVVLYSANFRGSVILRIFNHS